MLITKSIAQNHKFNKLIQIFYGYLVLLGDNSYSQIWTGCMFDGGSHTLFFHKQNLNKDDLHTTMLIFRDDMKGKFDKQLLVQFHNHIMKDL